MTIETIDLVGVVNGVHVPIGTMPMPPSMKAKEIVRSYFGRIDEDEGNEAAMALWACNELVTWMESQGWTPPPITDVIPASQAEKIAAQWRNFRDCPRCGAEKGSACRTPSCAQLQEAPPEARS
jgi:hypothetical protein